MAGSLTEFDLKPIADFVNLSLAEIQAPQTQFNSRTAEEQDSRKRYLGTLQNALGGIVFDNKRVTIEQLRACLYANLPAVLQDQRKDAISRLITDLRYIKILEKGGLEAINEELKSLFEELHKKTISHRFTRALHQRTAYHIADLTSQASSLFPHLASGIAIDFQPGALAKANSSKHHHNGRSIYAQFCQTYAETTHQNHPDRLILRLPVNNRTITDLYFRQLGNSTEPFFTVAVRGRSLSTDPQESFAHFGLDKITNIEFIGGNPDFTSYLASRKQVDNSVNHQLEPRENSLWYYLRSRGFEPLHRDVIRMSAMMVTADGKLKLIPRDYFVANNGTPSYIRLMESRELNLTGPNLIDPRVLPDFEDVATRDQILEGRPPFSDDALRKALPNLAMIYQGKDIIRKLMGVSSK